VPASNLDSKPVIGTFPINSPPTFLDGRTTGSTSKTMPPSFLKKSGKPPVVRPEWNTELPRVDLDQVHELLAIIAAHKEIGLTGASVMFSFFKRQIQPIQQCHTLGFEYIGTEDPSRMCAEELTDDAALTRVRRVLLDVDAVPYVPQVFSTQNPPKPVSIRLLIVENKFCYSATANLKSFAGTHRVVPKLSTTT
jgi:hypothetical protein